MSQTRDQANSEAKAARSAIQIAADNQFIANVDLQIAEAIAQGNFRISAVTSENVSLHIIFNYYADLGYFVSFPDYPANLNIQPVELFGQYWNDYWLHLLSLYPIRNPARINISWR